MTTTFSWFEVVPRIGCALAAPPDPEDPVPPPAPPDPAPPPPDDAPPPATPALGELLRRAPLEAPPALEVLPAPRVEDPALFWSSSVSAFKSASSARRRAALLPPVLPDEPVDGCWLGGAGVVGGVGVVGVVDVDGVLPGLGVIREASTEALPAAGAAGVV